MDSQHSLRVLLHHIASPPLSPTAVLMVLDCPVETEYEHVSAQVQVLENGVELLQLVKVK